MTNSLTIFIRELHQNSRELHDSLRELHDSRPRRAQFVVAQLYRFPPGVQGEGKVGPNLQREGEGQ